MLSLLNSVFPSGFVCNFNISGTAILPYPMRTLSYETVLRTLQGRRKSVTIGDTIELDKSFEDHVSLQDNGRAYFLYEYVYKRSPYKEGT